MSLAMMADRILVYTGFPKLHPIGVSSRRDGALFAGMDSSKKRFIGGSRGLKRAREEKSDLDLPPAKTSTCPISFVKSGGSRVKDKSKYFFFLLERSNLPASTMVLHGDAQLSSMVTWIPT